MSRARSNESASLVTRARPDPPALQAFGGRRTFRAALVDDQLACLPEHRLGQRVVVVGPDQSCGDQHHIRPQPVAEQHVRAAVDADQHRPLLVDEAAQLLELLVVPRSAGDDHHRPPFDPGAQRGQSLAVEEQVLLATQELRAVVGERLQLGVRGRSGPRRAGA